MKKGRLTKSEIANGVSMDTGYSRCVVEKLIDSVLRNITIAVSQGDEVRFTGFGTFKVKKRAARTGRNPHTNEPVPIPARVVPIFEAGSILKESVSNHHKERERNEK